MITTIVMFMMTMTMTATMNSEYTPNGNPPSSVNLSLAELCPGDFPNRRLLWLPNDELRHHLPGHVQPMRHPVELAGDPVHGGSQLLLQPGQRGIVEAECYLGDRAPSALDLVAHAHQESGDLAALLAGATPST